jgi:DNA-binding transcriptional LysR family regulator
VSTDANPSITGVTGTGATLLRLVQSGQYGDVLPGSASVDFDPSRIAEIPLPFLKNYSRKLCAVWNPRMAQVRPIVADAVEALRADS